MAKYSKSISLNDLFIKDMVSLFEVGGIFSFNTSIEMRNVQVVGTSGRKYFLKVELSQINISVLFILNHSKIAIGSFNSNFSMEGGGFLNFDKKF